MSVRTSLLRTVLFATVYVAATFLGRSTVIDGSSLSMVWPAAGVAAVWFCAQLRSPARWADVVALAAATMAVNVATGTSVSLGAVFVVANLVQVGVFVYLLIQWRPALWARDGAGLLNPRDLWGLLSAAFVATATGALIAPTGMWLVTGEYSGAATAVWLIRNTASVLVIGAVGLRISCMLSDMRRTARTFRRLLTELAGTRPARSGEYLLIVVCSLTAYLIAFRYSQGLPLAFPLLVFTVWAAVRLCTTFVVLHDLTAGALAVSFTLNGVGPFAAIGDLTTRIMVAQLFVAMIAVVGLTLALGRDERATLLAELATEREDARRQADLMHAIIDSMADGLAVIDESGQVTMRNPAGVRLLGGQISPGDVITGAGHYGIMHSDGTPMSDEELPAVRALAGSPVDEDVLIRNAGLPGARLMHVTATVVTDAADARQAVVVFRDVTEERRHRDELTDFAGVVAHDLLNPLTAVKGWAEIAAEQLSATPADRGMPGAADSLSRVANAATVMGALIDDLLNYTVTRDAATASGCVDLAAIVSDIAGIRADAAVVTGDPMPEFTVGRLEPVHADPARTRQLMDNLIGNAIRYTSPDVVPRLAVTGRTTGDGMVEVVISDNGIGIPPGHHASVFGNFNRAHRNSAPAGSGLGLAICKRIVERHGGVITAADNPAGGGTRITFTLPAWSAEASQPQSQPAVTATDGNSAEPSPVTVSKTDLLVQHPHPHQRPRLGAASRR